MAPNKPHQASPAYTQISRKSLSWLFVVQIFILAPHFVSVPAWIALVWVIVAYWRWQIFQGAWNYPNKIQKTLVVFACCTGLFTSFGVSFSFQSMISLLLVGFILKLLEMKARKDFILLIFVAFFILAAQFIEFTNFIAAFYGFFCLMLLCTTLMQLYRTSSGKNIFVELRPNFYILLQAIPFMIILFVVIPRMGSFWSVPSPQHAKTGMSDSMSPGDFSELMQSDELAFRVTFNDRVPSHEKLYWRSLVLSNFDGRRWSQNKYQYQQSLSNLRQLHSDLHSHIEYLADKNTYEVIAEPSGRPWLYALAAPQVWNGDIALTRDLRLQAFTPVAQRISYRVTSVLNYRLHQMSSDELAQNLQLPLKGNAQTRQLAREWLAESGSPEKLIEKLFQYYNKNFTYTLRPPPLGADSVDEFLLQSRQGFCEHFSSSFVFFMRAAGIPARVVVGYQGGDLNSVEGYLAVRQRDAHAWAEVWFENRGWVSMDPTAAVAPERIQKGIEESLSAHDQELLAKPFGSSLKMLMRLYDQLDALNFQWTRWVMNYDSTLQSKLLSKLLSDTSPFRIALFAVGAGFASLLVVFAILLLRTNKIKLPVTAMLYQQLCKKLKSVGYEPEPGETPRHFIQRIVSVHPELSLSLGRIIDLYEQLAYAEDVSVLNQLKQELLKFSPKQFI